METKKYGVTKEGYIRKTYLEFLEDLEQLAIKLFGNEIDLSPDNPLGKLIQIMAWYGSTAEETNEDIFLNQFIIFAEGKALENGVKNIGITRKAAQPSVINKTDQVIIKGQPGKEIIKGFQVGTPEGVIFTTTERKTIKEDGTASVKLIALQTGKGTNVAAGTINTIINPEMGIDSVENLTAAVNGTDIETDEELKARYFKSLSIGGNSTRESIEAALLNLEEVIDAKVTENTKMIEVDGTPPKSIAPLVYGGNEEEIALAIMKSKAAGIRSYGAIEKTVQDSRGEEHIIGFTIPQEQNIYLKVTIERDTGYEGDEQVKTSIIKYIGGQDQDQAYYKGLQLGESVVVNKIIAAIACDSKIKDLSVEISTTPGDYAAANIPIEKDQIATTDPEKVVIVYG